MCTFPACFVQSFYTNNPDIRNIMVVSKQMGKSCGALLSRLFCLPIYEGSDKFGDY